VSSAHTLGWEDTSKGGVQESLRLREEMFTDRPSPHPLSHRVKTYLPPIKWRHELTPTPLLGLTHPDVGITNLDQPT
jgi:hypothetical protein